MKNYTINSLQKTGIAHRFCQDRYKIVKSDERLIIICADGHGNEHYTRSHFGARIACEVAAKVFNDENCTDPAAVIKDRYDKLVKTHLKNRPLTEEELEKVGEYAHITVYGTTLMAAVLTPEYTELFQIGDGEICAIKADGSLFDALPNDSSCIGTSSSSMALPKDSYLNHVRRVRYYEPAAACFMFTDGCENGQLFTLENMLNNIDGFSEGIADMFEYTDHGDDQTFAAVYDADSLKGDAFKNELLKEIEMLKHLDFLKRTRNRNLEEHSRLKEKSRLAKLKIKALEKANSPELEEFSIKAQAIEEKLRELEESINFTNI